MLRPLLRSTIIIGILLCLSSNPTEAAKVKVWHHSKHESHKGAKLKQVVISDQGVVKLSRNLNVLADLNCSRVWALAEDKFGNLYVATGDQGKIFRINPAGKPTVVYQSADSQVLSLTASNDGSVYAGTGPSGAIVRIPPKGKPRIVVDGLGSYVWSLAVDKASGCVFAGTGPHGRIYRITPAGKATLFYQTKQHHILCLSQDQHDNLYAGTDKDGLVYRISPKGKGFVVYSTPQSEVRSLVVTARGVLAGTSSPSADYESQAVVLDGNRQAGPSKKSVFIPASKKKTTSGNIPNANSLSGDSSDSSNSEKTSSKGSPSRSQPSPEPGENSVYQIDPDGTVREIFRDKTLVLSTLSRHGQLLVGTGMDGQLFEINQHTKEKTEIARLPQGQIHCMLHRRDGSVVLGTGEPGKIYLLGNDYTNSGTLLSEVLDAGLISKWGASSWQNQTPADTKLTVSFRSGNVATPDETWSDWSEEHSDPEKTQVTSPTARYLQYRISLHSNNPKRTPNLQSVTVRYMTVNHRPEVTQIDVPNLETDDLEKPEKIKIKWKATDPNEDELTFSVFARKQGWKNWVCLAKDTGKKEYQWDGKTVPSGLYEIKITASDRPDNTTKDMLTASRVSGLFPVAHETPKVGCKVVEVKNGKALIEASAIDPIVRITHAAYAINSKQWTNVFPQDELFDSKQEQFRFYTDMLPPGNYVLVLRVRDAAGNLGTADVVFSIPK